MDPTLFGLCSTKIKGNKDFPNDVHGFTFHLFDSYNYTIKEKKNRRAHGFEIMHISVC